MRIPFYTIKVVQNIMISEKNVYWVYFLALIE